MKSYIACVFTASLGVAGIVASAAPVIAAGIGAEAKVLAAVDDSWSGSAVKKDADLLATFYAVDATIYPPNDLVFTGRPAARKYWAAAFADPTYSISWKTVSAGVSTSGELGFTGGTYEESYKGTDGKTVRNTGKYVGVWAKDKDGAWKCIQDIWNTDK